VTSNGASTAVTFQYGPTTAYGHRRRRDSQCRCHRVR
jgi:hypothetical protein